MIEQNLAGLTHAQRDKYSLLVQYGINPKSAYLNVLTNVEVI